MMAMKRPQSARTGLKELRQRAEERLRRRAAATPPPAAIEADTLKQLHELHVHQIELEMQNLELQRSRTEVEQSLARYTALYDFAPIGYFTLDRDGTMTQLNLTGANLLQQTRAALRGRNLARFMVADSQRRFATFLERVFSGRSHEILELELRVEDRQSLFVMLEGVIEESGASCRVVAVDVTARRQAERRADELLRQNRALAQRMFDALESERRELARELHDEIGQWLTAIQAQAEALRSSEPLRREPRLLASAVAIRDSAGQVHKVIRQMLQRLRPSLLDTLGLAESLRDLTDRWREHHPQIHCSLELSGVIDRVPDSLGITAYRIVQEALTNVAKHSGARHVAVRARCELEGEGEGEGSGPQGWLDLHVDDDGRGLDPEHLPSGLGLLGMRERVIAAAGEFSLRGEPGGGVQILARLPVLGPTDSRRS
jgi:two-component system nitrate/nitrite sensor histidine kinase NarX/two-component system sensor histidine kinase UhpB